MATPLRIIKLIILVYCAGALSLSLLTGADLWGAHADFYETTSGAV